MESKVCKGVRFRAVIADCNALWEVRSKVGRDDWKCVVVSEDYEGTERIFAAKEIESALKSIEYFTKARKAMENFYSSLKLGDIVHYDNGFGEFVRCIVVNGITTHSDGNVVKCLKPIALIGNWKEWDLPHRLPDGSVEDGYWAKRIKEGRRAGDAGLFQANDSLIFESPTYNKRPRALNPTFIPAIDLNVPEMSAEEKTKAKYEQLRLMVIQCLNNNKSDAKQALSIAKSILNEFVL